MHVRLESFGGWGWVGKPLAFITHLTHSPTSPTLPLGLRGHTHTPFHTPHTKIQPRGRGLKPVAVRV